MTTKKKNDSPNLFKRNVLIISIGFNILLSAMFLVLYVPTLLPPPPPTPIPTRIPGMPDPFQLTATELIRTATEGALTELVMTATPMPTLSAEDETALRQRFLNELETELGFLHPVLEETVDSLVHHIAADISIKNENGYLYNPIPESVIYDIDKTTFDGNEYVAVVIQSWTGWAGGTQGFIFRVTDGSPELLAETSDGTILEGFDDRNGNDFPDVALISNCGGSSCYDIMAFYEIRPNNGFVVLNSGLNATIQSFVDLEGDGIMELQGIQRLFVPESVQDDNKYYEWLPRWFYWNGEAYEPYPTFEGE